MVKKSVHILKKMVLAFVIFVAAYLFMAFVLSRIPVNRDDADPAKDVAVYISTNGVHTDLIFPYKHTVNDWSNRIDIAVTASKDTTRQFVAFGWGDRGFYLNTPEWSDLKASTAFEAAFYLGTSAMHVSFLHLPKESETCKKIWISRTEYEKMVAFVTESLQLDHEGKAIPIPNAAYGSHDAFFESKGKYNLFYTCNTWANNTLKSGNQKAALWTLTDSGIFCHYD
ncbi:TIGR02117 family protein [Flavobacterium sp.]|uniref:TIGR02117 family protein n=1 Tax=Flavobacterium sp. TaxID=239 RepID=UPI00261E3A5F|nr:TIGR02117 family protein [Flavobacterium sp.]